MAGGGGGEDGCEKGEDWGDVTQAKPVDRLIAVWA